MLLRFFISGTARALNSNFRAAPLLLLLYSASQLVFCQRLSAQISGECSFSEAVDTFW